MDEVVFCFIVACVLFVVLLVGFAILWPLLEYSFNYWAEIWG